MTPADLTAAHDGKRIHVRGDAANAVAWVGTYRHPGKVVIDGIEFPVFRDDRIELLDQEDPVNTFRTRLAVRLANLALKLAHPSYRRTLTKVITLGTQALDRPKEDR